MRGSAGRRRWRESSTRRPPLPLAAAGGGQGSWREIHYAAFEGELEKVKQLLRDGVTIDDVGPDGKSALHQAAGKGHMHVVNYLLEQKADPKLKDGKGRTPGQYAKQCGQSGVNARLAEVDGRPAKEVPEPEPGELGVTGRRRVVEWINASPLPEDLVQQSAEYKPVRTPR